MLPTVATVLRLRLRLGPLEVNVNEANNEIMDVRRAALFLGLTDATLRRLVREGQVPAKKVGKAWRFHRGQLAEWVKAGEVAS